MSVRHFGSEEEAGCTALFKDPLERRQCNLFGVCITLYKKKGPKRQDKTGVLS
jgi:hypothetical protein